MDNVETVPIGSCFTILKGVKTLVDGSVKIELEVNPEDQELISKLLRAYVENDRLLSVGFLKVIRK